MLVAYLEKRLLGSPAGFDSKSGTVLNMFVYGPDHHLQDQWLDVERCYITFLHLVVGVSRSVW